MFLYIATILFIPKKDLFKKYFYYNYYFINKFLKKYIVLVSNISNTITYISYIKRISKINIIWVFNYILVYINNYYLIVFAIY